MSESETPGGESADVDVVVEALNDIENDDIENEDGKVIARGTGLEDVEGQFECVICERSFETEHAFRTHYGSAHNNIDPDADVADVVDSGSDDDVDDCEDWSHAAEETESLDTQNDDDDDDDDAPLEEVKHAYAEAEAPEYPQVSKRMARDTAVSVLEDQFDWMSIRERCDDSHYDLHVWTGRKWEEEGRAFLNSLLKNELGSLITDSELNKIVAQLAPTNWVSKDEINAKHYDETLIPVENGVICIDDIDYDADDRSIDVNDVTLKDCNKEYRFTYRVQTEWNPSNADTDGLEDWLRDITYNERDRRVLYDMVGHALHPGYPTDAFQVLVGDGGSGKSQYLEVVRKLFGKENCSSKSISEIEERFQTRHVVSNRLNVSTELSGTEIESIDTLKTLTAGEIKGVERKNVEGWQERNGSTLLFSSDDPPAMPQSDKALGRRLYPVEFPASYVDDPDPDNEFELKRKPKLDVEEELRAEERLQAMLIKAVEGLTRILQEGDITDPRDWEDRVRAYESYASPIDHFAEHCLQDADDADVSYDGIESSALGAAFDRFADTHDHPSKSVKQIAGVLGDNAAVNPRKDRTRSFSDNSDREYVYRGVAFTDEAFEKHVKESDKHYQIYADGHGVNPDTDEQVTDVTGDRTTVQDLLNRGAGGRLNEEIAVEVIAQTSATYRAESAWVVEDAYAGIELHCMHEFDLGVNDKVVLSGAEVKTSNQSANVLRLKPGISSVSEVESPERESVLKGGDE